MSIQQKIQSYIDQKKTILANVKRLYAFARCLEPLDNQLSNYVTSQIEKSKFTEDVFKNPDNSLDPGISTGLFGAGALVGAGALGAALLVKQRHQKKNTQVDEFEESGLNDGLIDDDEIDFDFNQDKIRTLNIALNDCEKTLRTPPQSVPEVVKQLRQSNYKYKAANKHLAALNYVQEQKIFSLNHDVILPPRDYPNRESSDSDDSDTDNTNDEFK